jgi:tetratricopeptide (TPR) repeat protein
MKRSFLLAAVLCSLTGFAQIQMPAPSSTQKIIQNFGLGTIELVYSRPNIKGRSLLKDNSDLAPLNKLWRTGANAATRITFSDRIMMGGKLLDTGAYVLYTIPGKDYWEIVLNKGLTNWGTDGYKESEDVVRFKVRAEKTGAEVETFAMQFGNVLPESCELDIMWGGAMARIPMSVNIKDRIRLQVEKALSPEKVDANTYYSAANFYYEWDKNYNKALTSVSKAIAANPKAYYMVLLQAKIQRDMGDKVSAKASAEKTIVLATEAKNDDYVKQANDLIKKL